MGTLVLKNMPLWLGKYNLSNYAHAIAIDYGADPVEDTVLADTTHSFKGGLKSVGASLETFWDDTPDPDIFSNVGSDVVLTAATSELGPEGDPGFILTANQGSYSWGGGVGELLAVSLAGQGASNLVKGTIELQGTKTASGDSDGRQLGAVTAAQRVYAAIHATTVSGTSPTLDAIVQSDDNGGFTSATNRITFTQKTAISAEFASLAGAITDDYWRVNFTIGGSDTPTFKFVVCIGIL